MVKIYCPKCDKVNIHVHIGMGEYACENGHIHFPTKLDPRQGEDKKKEKPK